MRYLREITGSVALAVALAAAGVTAASPQTAAPKAATSSSVDPAAMAAMDKMSAALQALPRIAFDSEFTREQVLETGQKLQYGGRMSVDAIRPNGLKLVINSDTQNREFYFDGKALTIVAPKLNYYTSVDAPGSIGQMLERASTKYGVELPLADLFAWNSNSALRSRVTSAFVIRPETIGGRACMHYAFRQANADWQIWIEDGNSLPCKMVITDTSDPSMPQFSSVLTWRDASGLTPASFAFTPGSGMNRIAIADVSGNTIRPGAAK